MEPRSRAHFFLTLQTKKAMTAFWLVVKKVKRHSYEKQKSDTKAIVCMVLENHTNNWIAHGRIQSRQVRRYHPPISWGNMLVCRL